MVMSHLNGWRCLDLGWDDEVVAGFGMCIRQVVVSGERGLSAAILVLWPSVIGMCWKNGIECEEDLGTILLRFACYDASMHTHRPARMPAPLLCRHVWLREPGNCSLQ